MKSQFSKLGLNITTNPDFQDAKFGITPELKKLFYPLHLEASDKRNRNIIEKLTNLILKYPKSPQLKNFLSAAYFTQGNEEKAIEVNNWILTEHPDYLFAKINKAFEYFKNAEFDQIPLILGEEMELAQLFPERKLFHLAEVTGYLKVCVFYYCGICDIEKAENRMELLLDLAPDHQDTFSAAQMLLDTIDNIKHNTNNYDFKVITPKITKQPTITNKTDAPDFNFAIINRLYEFGIDIPREILIEILELPRERLIEDLEKILIDAEERYAFLDENGFDETTEFVVHSLFLLKEINATESLPKVLAFLENDEELLDLYLGVFLTEVCWQVIYVLGSNKTNILHQFLLKPGINSESKSVIVEALCQLYAHNPERKAEIVAILLDLLTTMSKATIEDNILDTDLLDSIVTNIVNYKLEELLPIVKTLYAKDYIDPNESGDYEEVEDEIKNGADFNEVMNTPSIFSLYDYMQSMWRDYDNDDEYIDDDEEFDDEDDYTDYEPVKPHPAVSDKIERNSPCPCGSGKKYKKCCGK